ncbi:MAG: queuosine precursor transporter [Patescibacteria group bacterium]
MPVFLASAPIYSRSNFPIDLFCAKIQDMFKIEKFDLLVSVYIFCIAVSELMGAKTFPLANIFGYQLNASVAIFVLPLIFTINDVITEVYGKERTRSVIRSGLIIIFLILLFSLFSTSLPPSKRFQNSEGAYDKIFGLSARVAAASLTAFAIAEFLDVIIFVKIRQALGKKALWFRNNASNFVSQLIDTSVFMFLAFYAFDKSISSNIAFLFSLILPYWLLKCSMSVIETPLVYIGVRWLKK